MPKPRNNKPAKAPPVAAKAPWLTVRNEASAPAAEIVISGLIGGEWWEDGDAEYIAFRDQFNAIPEGRKIKVFINSEGGSVKVGLGMYHIIRRRASDVTCINDGYCLSSASFVLMAGGKVICPPSSLMMIHEPWGGGPDTEDGHRQQADMLAKHADSIANIYAERTGIPAAEWREKMRATTWYLGEEALEAGLCDECEEMEEEGSDEHPANSLDLTQFRNVPEKVLALLGRTIPNVQNSPKPAAPPQNQPAPQPNIMDRTKILAALKEAGVTLPDNAKDEEVLAAFNKLQLKQAAPPQNTPAPTPAPTSANMVDKAEFEKLQKQLDNEKRTRITAEVQRRGENRIENKNLNWWVNLAMQDEAGTLAQIDSLPVNKPGGEPLGIGQIQVLDGRMDQIKKMPKASDRYEAVRAEYEGLIQDAFARDRRAGNVQNANTYSATLVTSFVADGFVTKLQNKWAPLKSFARDFSTDRMKPMAAGQVKFTTAGSTTLTDATNFEQGNSTVDPVSVTPHQYTQAFHVSNTDLNNGLRMENLIEVNTAAMADKILAVAFVPVTTANFTGTAITAADAAFGWTEMAQAWGLLKKGSIRNAILDGEYMARLLNNPAYLQAALSANGSGASAFGWDGVHLNTNWTGAGENVRGFFCHPQAICALSGLPLTPPEGIPGNTLQEKTIVVPGVNIPIAAYNWFSLGSRTLWMSYDLIFGVAKGDATAGFILKSA